MFAFKNVYATLDSMINPPPPHSPTRYETFQLLVEDTLSYVGANRGSDMGLLDEGILEDVLGIVKEARKEIPGGKGG